MTIDFTSHSGARLLLLFGLALLPVSAEGPPEQLDLFRAGEEGYHTYRIPALIVTKKKTLLAFCEARKGSSSDSGNIDLVLRRSRDNGKTWSRMQLVADFGDDTVGNPAPVVDQRSGEIILLLTRNPGRTTEDEIVSTGAKGARTVWITRSKDDGATWTPLEEITPQVKRPEWTWYATGPGNGIQTRSGRLVIPCDHIVKGTKAMHAHVIYSDDRGKSWAVGGVAEAQTNESAVAELRDGSLLLNMRSYARRNLRAVSLSRDGGLTWSGIRLDPALVEPVCQASLVAAVPAGRKSDGRLLFSNPADSKRVKMTVKLSFDDGQTWPVAKLIYQGPSAYSSLAVLPDRSIGLLYERGVKGPYEKITFARFTSA